MIIYKLLPFLCPFQYWMGIYHSLHASQIKLSLDLIHRWRTLHTKDDEGASERERERRKNLFGTELWWVLFLALPLWRKAILIFYGPHCSIYRPLAAVSAASRAEHTRGSSGKLDYRGKEWIILGALCAQGNIKASSRWPWKEQKARFSVWVDAAKYYMHQLFVCSVQHSARAKIMSLYAHISVSAWEVNWCSWKSYVEGKSCFHVKDGIKKVCCISKGEIMIFLLQ